MCQIKNESPSKSQPLSPSSPWAKLLNKQNLKPRLPKKLSTKVNLNKYWSKFGELVAGRPDPGAEPLVLPFSSYFLPVDPVKPSEEASDNEANHKISDGNRFELITDQEVDENISNEVREICLRNNNNCLFCNLCN